MELSLRHLQHERGKTRRDHAIVACSCVFDDVASRAIQLVSIVTRVANENDRSANFSDGRPFCNELCIDWVPVFDKVKRRRNIRLLSSFATCRASFFLLLPASIMSSHFFFLSHCFFMSRRICIRFAHLSLRKRSILTVATSQARITDPSRYPSRLRLTRQIADWNCKRCKCQKYNSYCPYFSYLFLRDVQTVHRWFTRHEGER